MTALDVDMLRLTLELALGNGHPSDFYRRLFDAHPELRALFHRRAIEAQNALFWDKLSAIIDHIEDPTWLKDELGDMARLHAEYGVTAEMYPWVGDALLSTLADACGQAWSPVAEGVWRRAYDSLAQALQSRR